MAFKRDDEYNRIFILGAKEVNDDLLRDEFDKYGVVKDVYFVKDRKTNERKDIAYVTFTKASEAALAIEQMNGKSLEGCPRPLKVILANNRNEGNVREANEDMKMLRLFIVVPRGFTESQINEDFSKFGEIENIRFVKDRKTGDSKSLAYVKFTRAYDAARALEEVNSQYKPVFATNQTKPGGGGASAPRGDDRRNDRGNGGDPYRRGPDRGPPPERFDRYASQYDPPAIRMPARSMAAEPNDVLDLIRSYPNNGQRVLEAYMPTGVTYDQTVRLFDIVPGLENFNYEPAAGHSGVVVLAKYSTPQLAAYAKEKLDDFEYPPGCRLVVNYFKSGSNFDMYGSNADLSNNIGNSILAMKRGIMMTAQDPNGPGAVKSLVDTVQKAMLLLQQTGLAPSATADMAWGLEPSTSGSRGYGSSGGYEDSREAKYCSVKLPERKPLAPSDSEVAERLFIVSIPEPFPTTFLEDCFCRFGDLISAYFMPGRNCGYVKYASVESARHAVNMLHMKTVCGNTLKVMVADEPPPMGGGGKRRYEPERQSTSPGMKHSRMS